MIKAIFFSSLLSISLVLLIFRYIFTETKKYKKYMDSIEKNSMDSMKKKGSKKLQDSKIRKFPEKTYSQHESPERIKKTN